jgi:hypothetical protein
MVTFPPGSVWFCVIVVLAAFSVAIVFGGGKR